MFCVGLQGRGTGNTALAYHAEKVLALHEGDLPYAVSLRGTHALVPDMPSTIASSPWVQLPDPGCQ